MDRFELKAPYEPSGDQPEAIEGLVEGLERGLDRQTLVGVTGSGKTFTMANVAAAVNRPTLVLSPNKTLAAQLYEEFRALFPDNRVEYFVSYYDYYQPEAYIPQSDTYIDKDSSINDSIQQYRHSTTQALAMRSDVLVVASVSCIYGLGDPKEYRDQHIFLRKGDSVGRDDLLRNLVDVLYERNDVEPKPGQFRAKGDTVDIASPDGSHVWRAEFWGEDLEALKLIDPLTGRTEEELDELAIHPARHFVTPPDEVERILANIEAEMEDRLDELRRQNKLVEAQRLETRTLMDLEMIRELGYCNGIENYSRHFTGRKVGEPPYTLLDHFPDDFLMFIDESHVAVPQVRGMYRGDRARKETLVEFGFRLPSALDNRPLRFEEFDERVQQAIFVSATPGPHEGEVSKRTVEQIVRPTGLIDPEAVVRPSTGQVDDLLAEIRKRVERDERVLVTTLTKRMAEELTTYYHDAGVRVRYIHADVNTIDRIELLEGLRKGAFDVLVGINLLREGLDLPEVSLVAILDADREGYLRSETSLVQTIGRAARNVRGQVLLYADEMTGSLRRALDETTRRRKIQEAYNREHGITPVSTKASRGQGSFPLPIGKRGTLTGKEVEEAARGEVALSAEERDALVDVLERRMKEHAAKLEFEEAAKLRDQVTRLKGIEVE